MILTPLSSDQLIEAIARLRQNLPVASLSLQALSRIADTAPLVALGVDLPDHRRAARRLCRRFGLETIGEAPAEAFSWDGMSVRTQTEASVLLHELAHWQIAPPDRRLLPDFGLGAGPETGRKAEADQAKCVAAAVEIEEESLASLLGILWEAELGQPAILAFAEQNWLEGYDRPGTADHFCHCVDALFQRTLIDETARPVQPKGLFHPHAAAKAP